MKQEQFKVTNYIKELAVNADKYLVNFPNKQIELKRKIIDTTYDLLLLTYKANATKDSAKRLEIQEECIAYIKVIDYVKGEVNLMEFAESILNYNTNLNG